MICILRTTCFSPSWSLTAMFHIEAFTIPIDELLAKLGIEHWGDVTLTVHDQDGDEYEIAHDSVLNIECAEVNLCPS